MRGSLSNAESSAAVSGLAEIHPQVYRFLEGDSSVGAFIFNLGDIFIPMILVPIFVIRFLTKSFCIFTV